VKLGCSYFGNRIVRHVAADMRGLARHHFTYALHTFSEFDLAFHRKTMKEIVAATHDAGMEAHLDPWGVGKVFGGEAFSQFASEHIFDACQILDDGRPAALACPNNPLFRDFMMEWIAAAAESKADVILWDEPHFHNPNFLGGRAGRWGCRCEFCRKLYRKTRGRAMPAKETPDVVDFKSECLRDFLNLLMERSAAAGLRNALCLAPRRDADASREDWLAWAQLPYLETLGADPYWQWLQKPVEIVSDYSALIKDLCARNGLEAQIWIQVCKIKRGSEAEIGRAIELAAAEGVGNLALWGYEGCAHESWIACDDPPRAWAAALRALKKF